MTVDAAASCESLVTVVSSTYLFPSQRIAFSGHMSVEGGYCKRDESGKGQSSEERCRKRFGSAVFLASDAGR